MVRNKKAATQTKSPKCSSAKKMPTTSGTGNAKETGKNKKKAPSGDGKSSVLASASSGRGTSKPETTETAPTVPVSEAASTSKKEEVITTPPRFFLRSCVKKPAKTQNPPPEKAKEKEKEEKAAKAEPPKAERKRWEAWSNQDKTLFFEAISEFGKDFDSVQKYIEHRHKKLGYPPSQNKNKDQVRHLYYRTCHKLSKYIKPILDQPRVISELYALINYGELRKKLKGGLTAKNGKKLDELMAQGVTYIRFNGRNMKVKTPVCKALKKLRNPEKDQEKPTKLPPRVLLELQPRSNAAWAEVQSVSHNPRLRLVVPLQKDMGSLLTYLSEKWTPHRIRLLHSMKPADKSNFNQVQLHVPKAATVTPYNQLHGRFIHTNSKTPFTIVTEDDSTDQGESPGKTATTKKGTSPRGTGKKGGANKNASEEGGSGENNDCMLHPDLDGDIQPMEVDLLNSSEPVLPDTGSLSSMFGDNHSLGDLLSLTNGGMGPPGENLSFGSLSLTLTGSHAGALSLASSDILHPVSIANSNLTTNSALLNGAGDSASSAKTLSQEEKELEERVQEEVKHVPKDVRLKEGLTARTAAGISATDVFLMMGKPEMLKFEYDFVKKEHPVTDQTSGHLMKKLLHLAKVSFSDKDNPKQFVSVGTVTSPTRSHTPPSKSNKSGVSGSPSTSGRSPRGSGSRGSGRSGSAANKAQWKGATSGKDDSAAEKDHEDEASEDDVHFAVPKSVAPTAVRRNQEPSHAQEGQRVLNQLEQMKRPPANFLLPRMKKRQRGLKPVVVQRTILPRPNPNDRLGDKVVSMAIINSSQANMGQFMPIKVNMSSLGQPMQSRASPRPIKPNISGMLVSSVAGANTMTTKTVLTPSAVSSKPIVRRIMPMNVPTSPLSEGNILHESMAAAGLSPAPSPLMPSSPSPESQVNQVSTSQLCSSPAPSTSSPTPLGSSTPDHGSPITITADSSLIDASAILNHEPSTPNNPISTMDSSVLNTPLVVEKEGDHHGVEPMDTSLLDDSLNRTLTQSQSMAEESILNTSVVVEGSASETPSSTNSSSTTLHISPPEISALLDISLQSEGGDGISSLSLDSTTFRTFGKNINISPNSTTTELLNSSTLSRDIGNVSPTSSPFKVNSLGPEAQWYNGESLDISMSSLLGHLESPEKKDRGPQTSTAASTVTSLSLPPGLLSESSRDSIITRDVDSTLQVMLNENSIDYIAKFADLTAQISATPDTPIKNSLRLIAKDFGTENGQADREEVQNDSEAPSLMDE